MPNDELEQKNRNFIQELGDDPFQRLIAFFVLLITAVILFFQKFVILVGVLFLVILALLYFIFHR